MIETPKQPTNYSIVCNEVAKRKDLSAKAKGIYYYLATLPSDWKLSKKELIRHFTDGRSAISTGFKELVEAGYIVEKQDRNNKGKFSKTEYKVLWSADKPFTENPSTDKRLTDNQPLQSNNNILNNKENKSTKISDLIELNINIDKINEIIANYTPQQINKRLLIVNNANNIRNKAGYFISLLDKDDDNLPEVELPEDF